MISDRVKARLVKDRPMTSITLRMPDDVLESLKALAPRRGFSGYQALLKSYVGEGLRRDEALWLDDSHAVRLTEALRRHGVAVEVLEAALSEVAAQPKAAA